MSQDQSNTFNRDLDLYTLSEASAKTGASTAKIMQAAADGHISLYTTIPVGWEVFSIDISDLPPCEYKKNALNLIQKNFNQSKLGSLEHADPSIELLKLSKDDSIRIKTSHQSRQHAFSSGLKTAHNHPPFTAAPQITKITNTRRISFDLFETLNRCFVVCKKPNFREDKINSNINLQPFDELEITPSMVRVAHNDLETLSLPTDSEFQDKNQENLQETFSNAKSNIKKYPKNISHRLYTPGRARTKLLETLYLSAKHSWEIRLITGRYPKQEIIIASIKDNCPECSDSLAQKMATIISPCAEDIEIEKGFFLTNQFWALIDTYEMFYLHTDRKKINKNEILKHLENHPQLSSVLTPATKIIDPDFSANKNQSSKSKHHSSVASTKRAPS